METDGEETASANEELTRDLISIIASFSAILYGLRSHKMKSILEAVTELHIRGSQRGKQGQYGFTIIMMIIL